jgi:hypothetical protein
MTRQKTPVLENLEEQVDRLSAMLEAQRQELDEQRQRLHSLEAFAPTLPSPGGGREMVGKTNGHSRRDLLRLAGAAVAGAAGTVALQAVPASAITGGNMLLGSSNDANLPTELHPTTGTPTSPLFQIDANAATNNAVGLIVAGANNANAAFFQGAGTGSGLSALSTVGDAISAQAGSGAAANGVVGTAGAGVTSNGLTGNAGAGASSIGVIGNAGAGATSAGVLGSAGSANSSAGVVGVSTGSFGVFAQATTGIDMIAGGNGRLAQVPFSAGGSGAPSLTPGSGVLEVLREDDGSVWVSRALAGAPVGTLKAAWKRMNAVRVDAADGSGNPFVAARVLNTINSTGTGAHSGPLLPGEVVDFGPFTNANGIPTDAVGVIGNLTAVASNSAGNPAATFAVPGWLALTPGGVSADPTNPVSNVNYAGPVNAVPNFFVIGFGTGANAGKLRIQNGGNTKVHVLLDVFGILQ